MVSKLEYGNWAQVIGNYDLEARKGTIQSINPTKIAFESLEGGEDRVRLKGYDDGGQVIFDLAVNPMAASCGIIQNKRSFEEFVPITPSLGRITLFVDGVEVSQYVPGGTEPRGQVELGAPIPNREHHIPLSGDIPAATNISYALQVRPDGDTRWHTLAAGLDRPDAADVDVNQFPGASAIDVRVLRSNGLESEEIFRERREFLDQEQ